MSLPVPRDWPDRVIVGSPFHVSASTPLELVDNDDLDDAVQQQFRAGVITLGWDPTTGQVVIAASYPLERGR